MAQFIRTLWRYKITFIFCFVVVFATTFFIVYFSGLAPQEISDEGGLVKLLNVEAGTQITNTGSTTSANTEAFPSRIVIPKIGVDSPVLNPNTRDPAALDEVLKSGVVRYPGSGTAGKGNMFLFGHSSYLAVIHNVAYKALNHLDRLTKGDEVHIYAFGRRYVYMVSSVEKENEHQVEVDLASAKNKITISTCDTFSGVKQQRIVVEADFTRVE